VFDLRGQPRFRQEALDELLVAGQLRRQYLYRHGLLQRQVYALVHRAHRSTAHLPVHAAAADDFADQVRQFAVHPVQTSQPLRYWRLTYWSSSGAFLHLKFSPSHSTFWPIFDL
jgi:hypothetical protein